MGSSLLEPKPLENGVLMCLFCLTIIKWVVSPLFTKTSCIAECKTAPQRGFYTKEKKKLILIWEVSFYVQYTVFKTKILYKLYCPIDSHIWVTWWFEDINLYIQFVICNIGNGIFAAICANALNLLFQRNYMWCKRTICDVNSCFMFIYRNQMAVEWASARGDNSSAD